MSETLIPNRVDFMLEASEDSSEILRKFIRIFSKYEDKIFLFLEGADDIGFYFQRFTNYLREAWKDFVCNGRNNVISLIKDLKEHTRPEYRDAVYYGFIDKDYYEVINNPDKDKIYITPCYSIENFYISNQFFKNILERKFHLNESTPNNTDYQRCYDNFISRRNEFVEAIKELDIYLRCNRIMYEEKKISSKINARDINLKSAIDINLNNISSTMTALQILNKSESDFDSSSLDTAREFYTNKTNEELVSYIRGKFIFYFILHYLCKLKNENHTKNSIYFIDSVNNDKLPPPNKIRYQRCTLQLSTDNHDLIPDLAQFTITPNCLETFLRKIAKDHNIV